MARVKTKEQPLRSRSRIIKGEKTMKQNLINEVIQGMLPFLNNAQTEKLQEVLQQVKQQQSQLFSLNHCLLMLKI